MDGTDLMLKAVAESTEADCCPPDLDFLHMETSIDLSKLSKSQTTVVNFTFFFQLPHTNKVVKDASGNERELKMWHGEADLMSLDAEEIQDIILDNVNYDHLIDTKKPAAGSANTRAAIDEKTILKHVLKQLHKHAYLLIRQVVFGRSCPGYRSDPFFSIKDISMEWTEEHGNRQLISVVTYDVHFWGMIHFMAKKKEYKKDIIPIYHYGFNSLIKEKLMVSCDKYHDYHETKSDIQKAAMQTNMSLLSMQSIRSSYPIVW